ncbi:hypothetical protein ACFE04_002235 [Oxalis oulophora]
MGGEVKGQLIMVFISFFLFMSANSFSLQNDSVSDSPKETNSKYKRTYDHGTNNVHACEKIAHGGIVGEAGGGARSNSGGSMIPIYTAGAHNHDHSKHHHSSTTSLSHNRVGLLTLIMSALVSLSFVFWIR